MQDTAQLLSDTVNAVIDLESKKVKTPPVVSPSSEGRYYFEEEISLVDESGTSTTASTSWADSLSAQYIPSTAKYAIIWAGVRDTVQGVGTTLLEGRGGNTVRPIAEVFEPGTGNAVASFSECIMPVSGGRFDWRITLAAGATSAKYRISLLGYIE